MEILFPVSPHWCPEFLPLSFLLRTMLQLLGDTCYILLVTPAYKVCMNKQLLETVIYFIHPLPQIKAYSYKKIQKTEKERYSPTLYISFLKGERWRTTKQYIFIPFRSISIQKSSFSFRIFLKALSFPVCSVPSKDRQIDNVVVQSELLANYQLTYHTYSTSSFSFVFGQPQVPLVKQDLSRQLQLGLKKQ